MGLVIFFIFNYIIAFIWLLLYIWIVKIIAKKTKKQFSYLFAAAWGFFVLLLFALFSSWLSSIPSWQCFIPFFVILTISFHVTFRKMRHYNIFLLLCTLLLLGIYYLISIQNEKNWLFAEKFFFKNFPTDSYVSPQILDKKYFHFITRQEMNKPHITYEKDFFDLETKEINPVLVPNIVYFKHFTFDSQQNKIYLNNKIYHLKNDEIYILDCHNLFDNKKIKNLFEGKKLLCIDEYHPVSSLQNHPYQNIIDSYTPKKLPTNSSYSLHFLLKVQPYMYTGRTNISKDDLLFVDIVFKYETFRKRPRYYYNPELKPKNFCPVAIFGSDNHCIDFRKLFIPDNK